MYVCMVDSEENYKFDLGVRVNWDGNQNICKL